MSERLVRPTTLEELHACQKNFVTEESIRLGLAFQPRPTDVIITPYSKSGTTWVQQIVHGLRTRGSMDFREICYVKRGMKRVDCRPAVIRRKSEPAMSVIMLKN